MPQLAGASGLGVARAAAVLVTVFYDRAMAFYVYENSVHGKAIVHRGSCAHCKEGRGRTEMSSAERTVDEWLGPFPTDEAARTAAAATGRTTTGSCGSCM